MQVKWLRKALRNLEQAYTYNAQADQTAAIQLVLKIQAAAENLANFPNLGKAGRVEGTRELTIPSTPYVLIYKIQGQSVVILRVLHSARKYPD